MRRKRRRKYCVALDNTGVAVGCLLADPRAVDQDNTETAFCEMQRHRCADNARTENHCISTCHTHLQKTLSLYMDCHRRERYQTPILTAAGVSPNEFDQRPRGRTHPLRPPWDAYSSGVDLYRPGGAASCCGVSGRTSARQSSSCSPSPFSALIRLNYVGIGSSPALFPQPWFGQCLSC